MSRGQDNSELEISRVFTAFSLSSNGLSVSRASYYGRWAEFSRLYGSPIIRKLLRPYELRVFCVARTR